MKKLLAILCAVMLLATCSLTALAADDGSITITGFEGQTYNAYRIFDLKFQGDAYTYTVNADWADYFATGAEGLNYFEINTSGAVSAKTDADLAAFAKLALAYALENNIDAIDSATIADGATTATIDGLAYGYYLVDSTVGTLCVLNSTTPEMEISDKNAAPTISKEVEEDDTNAFGSSNTAELGQTVNFKLTVTAQEGAENYVIHDTMENLTFVADSVKVMNGSDELVKGTHYTLTTTGLTDGCAFELEFTDSFADTLTDGETVIVTYSATVDADANIAGEGNDNTAVLKYGENSDLETQPAVTTTYVYAFDLVKTDKNAKLLTGAEFELYRNDKTTLLYFVYDSANDVYNLSAQGVEGATSTIVVRDGNVRISGLDTDTYQLKETKAPEGYNLVIGFTEVKVAEMVSGNTTDAVVTDNVHQNGGVKVINLAGNVLPGTGSFGTTMFIIIGGGLALVAAVLLVSKKRMANLG